MLRFIAIKMFLIVASSNLLANDITLNTIISPNEIPQAKRTQLHHYITSEDVYEILKTDQNILFIDVRDPVEIGVMGHPSKINAIVPFRIQADVYDENLGEFKLVENENFLDDMKKALKKFNKTKHDMIIITCGSGYRSALATRLLEQDNYTNVWHIPDGYDGDTKPGLNTKNAWQIKGLPWSKTLVHGSEWHRAITEY